MIVAPLCGGIAAALIFNAFPPYLHLGMFILTFVVGVFWSIVIGWPMLAILNIRSYRNHWYVMCGSAISAVMVWAIFHNEFLLSFWSEIGSADNLLGIDAVQALFRFLLTGFLSGALFFNVMRRVERRVCR